MRTALAFALLCACSAKEPEAAKSPYTPAPLPPLGAAPLTDELTFAPKHARLSPADKRTPSDPMNLAAMLGEGFGDLEEKPGESRMTRTADGKPAPAPGKNARLLARFAHLPDFQLADDESPARVAGFDGADPLDGAYRPHEGHQCRIVNALVRTVNRVHEKLPIDFTVLGGDNSDNAQTNEVKWVMALLDGAPRLECDSGADDDPLPGPDNDPKDPFIADGLKMPWYWVSGNHDVEKQGTLPVDAKTIAESIGDTAGSGTRDWSQPGAPVLKGPVIPDPERKLLAPKELLALVAADRGGHGIGAAVAASGKATYTFDVPGTPLRFVVVDTNAETGGSDGLLHKDHVDKVVKPALDKAAADKKWVVVTSHHRVGSIGDGGDFGGTKQPDAFTSADYVPLLASYPNVLFSVVGHSHVHDIHLVGSGGRSFWEVITGSVADYKHQARIIEIWDQDDGFVMLRATSIDYRADGDPVAGEGRRISTADYVSGWGKEGSGTAQDRNVELWIAKP